MARYPLKTALQAYGDTYYREKNEHIVDFPPMEEGFEGWLDGVITDLVEFVKRTDRFSPDYELEVWDGFGRISTQRR
jgi:hypothetical protein